MQLLTAILEQFMGLGVLVAIILFQQELRKFLFLLGGTTTLHKNPFWNRLFWKKNGEKEVGKLVPILEAVKFMGDNNTGALIVFSKNDDLRFYEESGDAIGAIISKRLLIAIFDKRSPLHDGGVIIRNEKIVAARCILPITEQQDLPPQFGLRHRAAIGITETTNSLVLIVSEETGQTSIAREGGIERDLSTQEIRTKISEYLYG